MNRTTKSLVGAWLLLLPAQVGVCSEEAILEPDAVHIHGDAGPGFGEVGVDLRAIGRGSERRISEMTLDVGGMSNVVPDSAFVDLEPPLLNTVDLRTEAGYDDEPWLYISFQVGSRTSTGEWHPRRVRIAYHKGRIESRTIETPNPDGSSTWQEEDLTGGEVTPAPREDPSTEVLEIRVPGTVEMVYWSTQSEACVIQISFPPVADDSDQPAHPPTQVWVLDSNRTAIPQQQDPDMIGISKSGYVTESMLYRFPPSAREDATVVVVSVDDQLFVERLARNTE